jgi:PIN domain nuclease of toxin-antitoxin system
MPAITIRNLPAPVHDALRRIAAERHMSVEALALSAAHAATPLHEPISHRDPFDEILLVQAQVEGLKLLTRDARLVGHSLTIRAS